MNRRLHSFRVVFLLLLAGILGDLLTTAIGVHTDPAYEQNPLGSDLIAHGWLVVGAVTMLVAWVAFRLCRLVIERRPQRARWLLVPLSVACFVRWTAAITAILALRGM